MLTANDLANARFEAEQSLEVYRLWRLAGRPGDLSQFCRDIGRDQRHVELPEPDVVVWNKETTHGP